jgi:hypothetical protein
MSISTKKPSMSIKKKRKYESNMTYLAGFIVIRVKGVFHSDWLGAVSPIGPQLFDGETGQSGNPPCTIEVS